MKVRDLIRELIEFNMNAEVVVSTGDTFDDVSDFTLSYGGPDSGDMEQVTDAKYVYINFREIERMKEQMDKKEEIKIIEKYASKKIEYGIGDFCVDHFECLKISK